MSDNNQSGAPSTAPGAASTGENPGFGVFGANRGSGLARGKRPATTAASNAAPAAPSGYKPSAREVITPKSEYVNPFTGETAVDTPRANEPVPQAAPAPVPAAPVAEAPAPAPAPAAQVAPAPAPARKERTYITPEPAQPGELFPLDAPSAPAEKAELKILPTEEPKRPAVSWDSSSSAPAGQPPRREERATFRTERNRREDGAGREGREGKPFEPREPRRDERKFEPREKQPYQPRDPRDERPERAERGPRPETPAPAKKSGGFFGWLKGLFGGGKSAETPSTGGSEQRHDRDGDQGGRRRHRGGRGRGRGGFDGQNRGGGQPFQHRDPRDETGTPHQGGDIHHDEPRGEHHGEHRDSYQGGNGGRRRRRGGRGRFRGEGGDRGGPRPEGQQGGGAI
jgi:translation initiation factor IF-2